MGIFSGNKKRSQSHDINLLETALAESKESVRVLLRRTDLYPVFISVNFENVFGVDPQRIIDDVETLYRFVPEVHRAALKKALSEWNHKQPLVLDSDFFMPRTSLGANKEVQYLSSTPNEELSLSIDGSGIGGNDVYKKHFRVTFTSVLDNTHTLVEFIDTTSEDQAIHDIEEERDEAIESTKNRTGFFSQMSHEIRTPLNGIKGVLTLAKDYYNDTEKLLDNLTRADELSSYLLTLVEDMLDMARLDSGRVELELLPFDMRLVAQGIDSMFRKQAEDKGIIFTVESVDCHTVFLLGDCMRLNRVIVNFVSNALKFTESGGNVTVTFREMYQKEDEVSYMIRVRDTGKGMDPRFVGRIFKPFEQEDRTIARRYGGTGLGMPIAGALVELAGGEVVVDTELGRGTDFTAYIPFKIASQEQKEELEERGETLETNSLAKAREASYDFKGKHFLMAEDNSINAMIAVEVLNKLGASVDVAEDGPIVVEMFEESKQDYYDAILMDIQMATFNGWEATRRIRALEREDATRIPIIALSANNYAEDARKSREAGMNGHVGKPLDYSELKTQLAVAVAETAYKGVVK